MSPTEDPREINTGILSFSKISIEQYNKPKPFRTQVIDEVLEHINMERSGRYKPLTPRFVATSINTFCKNGVDLGEFIKSCRKSGYGKIFFWAIDSKGVKKHAE